MSLIDAKVSNPHHSAASVEHYTPKRIVDAARATMGEIDLDPASCHLANETVNALSYYDITANGLALPWRGRLFLNPPGGALDAELRPKKNGALSATKVWWRKLVREWQSDHVEQAIFVAFSIEALQSTQNFSDRYPFKAEAPDRSCADFPVCVPSSRIAFLSPKNDGSLAIGAQPTHSNAIIYLPPNDCSYCIEAFDRAFSPIGKTMVAVSRAARHG